VGWGVIAVRSYGRDQVLVTIDTGASRAETVLSPAEARELSVFLTAAAMRATQGDHDTKARRVGDEVRASLHARILLVPCPACRAARGVDCAIGRTPHADRRTAAVRAGVVSP
jgi:hypothetical protein